MAQPEAPGPAAPGPYSGYGAPGYGPPAAGAPGPGAPAPGYGAPGYGPPASGAPASGGPAPGYGPPSSGYGTPEYGPSAYGAPQANAAYGAPPPPPPNRPVGLIIGAIVAAVVLIMVAGGVIAAVVINNRGSNDDPTIAASDGPTAAPTTQGAPSAAEDPTTDSTAPTSGRGVIGKPVQQGDIIMTVLAKPECGVKSIGSGYTTYEPKKGQWCLISMKFENVGKSAVKPRSYSTKLIDGQGGETLMDLFSFKANPDDKLDLFENIYPGKAVTGIIAFDIPSDQVPATLKLNPDGDYDDEVQISLK
ncbi:DUF4352 domain-containing protein [Cryptosporangium sp. NPDC051539]|uniref:DUF4352 domain-containing protein n=1 Tax=Cryptosporangium sp. NPDC051539 TaxID=3363962 RepID=UPI0037B7B8A0